MKKLFSILVVLVTFQSCALTPEQRAQLHNAAVGYGNSYTQEQQQYNYNRQIQQNQPTRQPANYYSPQNTKMQEINRNDALRKQLLQLEMQNAELKRQGY